MVAQQDLTTDPALQDGLLVARSGTAFFGRKLNELSDEELDAPSLLPGWTRRHVIAHVSYNAQGISRLMSWANTGVETPMYESVEARNREIEDGARLSADALRSLFIQTASDLDAAWRDTPQEAWEHLVKTSGGATVPASETAWMRTRETYMHAVDLGNEATFSDLPASFNERLLRHIMGVWTKRGDDRGLVLKVSGSETLAELGDLSAADPEIISGTLPDVAAWSCGRASTDVVSSRRENPVPPHWQ